MYNQCYAHMHRLAYKSCTHIIHIIPQNQTQHTRTQTYTALLHQDDINSDNVPPTQWILELLTTPSARLDPIIKVSSKETNWISAGICNWKLTSNDALWSRSERSVDINQTSLCCDRLDFVVRCSINIIRAIKFIWSYKTAKSPHPIPSVSGTYTSWAISDIHWFNIFR